MDPEKQSFIVDSKVHSAAEAPRTTPTKYGARAIIYFLIAVYGLSRLSYLFGNVNESTMTEPVTRTLMSTEEKEHLFLSTPNTDSATATAKHFATHPHLAGSLEDYDDALSILSLFQSELGITPSNPGEQPIYSAGTPKSRAQTIALTMKPPFGPTKPYAWIDTYYPYLDTPLDSSLDIVDDVGNSVWSADLVEDGDPLDPDASKYKDYVHAWHGFSGHGEGQGQLVYVNYGTYEDFEEVLESGQNVTGKIVIARYGKLYRGLKIKRAEELGAAGVIIFSDPRDDGFVTVENGYTPYPHGPARNPTSVQRGSAVYLSIYPGDPSTPGYPAYENAQRVPIEEQGSKPHIPSLPVSWQNAQRLLEEIGQEEIYVEKDGKKRLSGKASERSVKLVNHVDYKPTPIWNAYAAIPGHVRDEVVVIGCHRDAWVLGAADPVSGTVSLVELVRGLGALLRQGWKPLRTIVVASWDAEEHGLVGSTEYGEDFSEWISEHVVAYLNVDVSTSGSQFNAAGSPLLAHAIKKTAADVPHPYAEGKSLWDARFDEGPFKPSEVNASQVIDEEILEAYERRKALALKSATGVEPMGSGSDFTVFLQRLGVASTDQGFSGTPYDAPYHYHSIYDSMRWQQVYGDPEYKRHVAVAQHLGLLALRITDSIIVPLNTTQYSLELDDYLDIVESLSNENKALALDFTVLRSYISALKDTSYALDIEKKEAEERFRDLLSRMPEFPRPKPGRDFGFSFGSCSSKRRSRFTRRVADWIKGVFGVQPYNDDDVHRQDSLRERLDALTAWEDILSAQSLSGLNEQEEQVLVGWLEYRVQRQRAEGIAPDYLESDALPIPGLPKPPPIFEFIQAAKRVSRANKKLVQYERGFISEGGIKDREWYKHLGVAPGKWLGYGATTFPALTEAITLDKNSTAAKMESERLVQLLTKMEEVIRP